MLILMMLGACTEKKNTQFAVDKVPDPMQHNGYVSNPDHLISDVTEQALNDQMRQLDQSGRAQVAIVLLETIGEQVPKDVAHEIFKLWKPGDKQKNNGLVVLLVNDQHRIEFETGYGLEGDLPDVVCFRIQQSEMLPSFKQNDLDGGMVKGMTAVIKVLQSAGEDSVAENGNNTVAHINEQPESEDSVISDDRTTFADIPGDAAMAVDSVVAPADEYPVEEQAQTDYPYEDSGDEVGVGTVVLYVFYAILSTIFVIQTGNKKRKANVIKLFKFNLFHIIWIYALPFVLMLVLVNFFDVIYRWWMLPLVMYGNLLSYHIYRTLVVQIRGAVLLRNADRQEQYNAWNFAHANHFLTAIFFPIPFFVFSRWFKKRLNKIRYDPYTCEGCHQPMTMLKKSEKLKLLDEVQLVEDKVGGITYDVWRCKTCNEKKTIGFQNLDSDVEDCPSCKAVTLVPGKKKVIRRATSSREGEGVQYFDCKHCQFTKQETYVIPRPSSGSSGSSGSSSSSSSSSSSWGGGSSGGGGAGSSW